MSGGRRGRAPILYLQSRAARYLGVPVWELDDQPLALVYASLMFESAEAWAADEWQKRTA